ncbi:hypothetical protein SOVF_049710 [Spinacia oleracea]|nr:hypothetical protein SOVF_049710 [Spinacia oleracea]
MKEEGNLLFKKGLITDALEKYGYAGVILGCFVFEEKEHISNFYDLAICILLNSAACFSKKNEHEQVGLICSIILEFNPNNVKALYRRAMAAIELGRSDFAYWDLLLASEFDPSNCEVAEKLGKIKHSLMEMEKKNHVQNTTPLGLGIGLSYPQKRPKRSLVEKSSNECDPQEESIKDKSENFFNVIEDNQMDEDVAVTKSEMMEDCESVINFESSNMVEPKYRFANRRRPGSSLTISKKDYLLLRQGKSIQYYNPRLWSPMVIRIMPGARKHLERSSECQENSLIGSTSSIIVNDFCTKHSVDHGSDDLEMEIGSIESKENEEHSEVSDNFSDKVMDSQFRDGCMFRSKGADLLSSSRKQGHRICLCAERRKRVARSCVKESRRVHSMKATKTMSCTHIDFACRSVGMKRKCIAFPSDLVNRPRKKSLSILCLSSNASVSNESCLFSSVSSSTGSCYMGCSSSVGSCSHETAIG